MPSTSMQRKLDGIVFDALDGIFDKLDTFVQRDNATVEDVHYALRENGIDPQQYTEWIEAGQ